MFEKIIEYVKLLTENGYDNKAHFLEFVQQIIDDFNRSLQERSKMKIRAWDTVSKEMIYSNEYAVTFDGEIIRAGTDIRCNELIPLLNSDVNDYNGNVIYEGDILCFGDRRGPYAEVTCGSGCFWYMHHPLYELNEDVEYPNVWNVVGNIYENPELLENL